MTETNFRRALLISNGSPKIFFSSVYCIIFGLRGILAGLEQGAAGAAHRLGGESVVKLHALPGQGVQIGRGILRKLELPPVPILLGLVLGSMTETNFRRALLISNGNPKIFFSSDCGSSRSPWDTCRSGTGRGRGRTPAGGRKRKNLFQQCVLHHFPGPDPAGGGYHRPG